MMACKIIDKLWNTSILSGFLQTAMIGKARKHFRAKVFSPVKIMELLDMNGGQLSYQGLDLLRQLETNGESYVSNTIIPHSTKIQRIGKAANLYAQTFVPFVASELQNGTEFIEFEPKPVIKLVMKGYQLDKKAKLKPIRLNFSMDGQQLSARNSVTTMGIKWLMQVQKIKKWKFVVWFC
jgi:hypothetical protein